MEATVCPGPDSDVLPGILPSTSRTHRPTAPRGHGQEVLRREARRVSRVSGRRNSVRDRAVVVPLGPYVLNACTTALRRSRGNGVS
jgi:hypothetical protein